MSNVSQLENAAVSNAYETTQTQKKSKVLGKTIGNPALSEKAQKYYEELKKKYSNMDFILVSEDQKEKAQSQAGAYANANRMVVLIDENKVEKMAEDATYRDKYEGIIANASVQMPQLQQSLASTSANVKTYGVQVNSNGTASYFAVLDKSAAAQKQRIEKKSEQKKAAKKAEAKKAAKKDQEDKIKEKQSQKEVEAKELSENLLHTDQKQNTSEDTVTITASSVEELVQKVNDVMFAQRSDTVQTDAEKMVGQKMDYRI